MKKITYLFLLLTFVGFSQTVKYEGFENAEIPTTGDNDGSFVGENNVTWTYNRVRSVSGTDIISGSVTLLLRSSDSYITSSAIPNGVTAVSFLINQPFGGFTSDLSTDVSVSLLKASDDSVIETLTKTYAGRGSDSEPNLTFTYDFSSSNINEDVKIQLSNASASSAGIVSFDDVEYTVFNTASINDFNSTVGKIYQNAKDDNLIIDLKRNENFEVSIYNILGKKIISSNKIFNKKANISTANIKSGIYIVKIDVNNRIYTKKIVKP